MGPELPSVTIGECGWGEFLGARGGFSPPPFPLGFIYSLTFKRKKSRGRPRGAGDGLGSAAWGPGWVGRSRGRPGGTHGGRVGTDNSAGAAPAARTDSPCGPDHPWLYPSPGLPPEPEHIPTPGPAAPPCPGLPAAGSCPQIRGGCGGSDPRISPHIPAHPRISPHSPHSPAPLRRSQIPRKLPEFPQTCAEPGGIGRGFAPSSCSFPCLRLSCPF